MREHGAHAVQTVQAALTSLSFITPAVAERAACMAAHPASRSTAQATQNTSHDNPTQRRSRGDQNR